MSNNLKPWQSGQSGNPQGRPKGARSWSKVVNEMLNDEHLLNQLVEHGMIDSNKLHGRKAAIELITLAQVAKAINGDYKAAEWLRKVQCEYDVLHTESDTINIALVEFIGRASDDEPRELVSSGDTPALKA